RRLRELEPRSGPAHLSRQPDLRTPGPRPGRTDRAVRPRQRLGRRAARPAGLAGRRRHRPGRGRRLSAGPGVRPRTDYHPAAVLGLTAEEQEAVRAEAAVLARKAAGATAWEPPGSVPLLRDLLCLAAENRRLTDLPVLGRLESDVDHLHHALEGQRVGEAERL